MKYEIFSSLLVSSSACEQSVDRAPDYDRVPYE